VQKQAKHKIFSWKSGAVRIPLDYRQIELNSESNSGERYLEVYYLNNVIKLQLPKEVHMRVSEWLVKQEKNEEDR